MRIEAVDRWETPEECLSALKTQRVGRVSVTMGALPVIVPVAYAIDLHAIAIRVPSGSDLIDALNGTVVAFEAGTFDPASQEGWTVHAHGVANLVDHLPTPADTQMARIDPVVMDGYRYLLTE